jgi:hypothetical protein
MTSITNASSWRSLSDERASASNSNMRQINYQMCHEAGGNAIILPNWLLLAVFSIDIN